MKQKIKFVFIPFLIIGCCFIVIYTLLNWLLIIQPGNFTFKEDLVNLWLPLVLPAIPVFIWLRPRIKLLALKRKTGDLPTLYFMIAWLAVGVPAVLAQKYLLSATGKLTRLNNIADMKSSVKTKYYLVEKHVTDTAHACMYKYASTSGKHSEHYEMSVFIVVPVLKNLSDTTGYYQTNWIGYKYHHQVSSKLSHEKINEAWAAFTNETMTEFEQRNTNNFAYLQLMGNTEDRDKYIKAVTRSGKYNGANRENNIFTAVNEPFSARNGNTLAWLCRASVACAAIWLIMVLLPKMDKAALNKFKKGDIAKNDDGIKDIKELLLPRPGYYITPILIHCNLLVFITMVFAGLGFISFDTVDLLKWGANYKPYIMEGQWWRLLSCIFLHGGIAHLLANMYGLLFVGIFLEPVTGKKTFLIVYLVTGVLASLTSLYWHEHAAGEGASGAIFGMYGVFIALLLAKLFDAAVSRAFLISASVFIGFNLLAGLTGNTDNAAHMGGLISGFIAGLMLAPALRRRNAMVSPSATADKPPGSWV